MTGFLGRVLGGVGGGGGGSLPSLMAMASVLAMSSLGLTLGLLWSEREKRRHLEARKKDFFRGELLVPQCSLPLSDEDPMSYDYVHAHRYEMPNRKEGGIRYQLICTNGFVKLYTKEGRTYWLAQVHPFVSHTDVQLSVVIDSLYFLLLVCSIRLRKRIGLQIGSFTFR